MEVVNFKRLFQSGAKAWNAWRNEHPDRIPDLTGTRLKGITIEGYDFSKMNFKLRFFEKSTIKAVNFSSAKFKATTFEGCTIQNTDFQQADLGSVNFKTAIILNCNFSGANLESAKFNGALLDHGICDENTNFSNAIFDDAKIKDSNVEKGNFHEADIMNCRFEGENRNVLEALKTQQIEAYLESERKAQERSKIEEQERKARKAKIRDLEYILAKYVEEKEGIALELPDLIYQSKIKAAYLEAFEDNEALRRQYDEAYKTISLITFSKEERLTELELEIQGIKQQIWALSRFENDRMLYKMIANYDYEDNSVTKEEVLLDLEHRQTALELPEQLSESAKPNNVCLSIYSIDRLEKGSNSIIQVWLYQKKLKGLIDKLAKQFNKDVEEKARKSLFNKVNTGDRITLILSANEFEYTAQKEFIWDGDKACENFLVKPPKAMDDNVSQVTFSLYILIEGLPIGDVHFTLTLGSQDYLKKSNIKPINYQLKALERAFISYASKDREDVLARVQGMLLSEKYKIFLDVINLSGGEKWEPRLYQEIEHCDVFFLFWSKAASKSKWVKREIKFALQCKKDSGIDKPRIHPVIIPPPQKPPKTLSKFHFNDPIVQFILAEKYLSKG